MARIEGKFIKGKVGPTVYKKYRNKQVLQKLPNFTESSHTAASKKSANTFGKASSLAMHIRDNLNPIITDFTDGEMVNRLNSESIHILNQALNKETGKFIFLPDSFSRLNGFEFNAQSMVRNIFYVQPELQVNGSQLKIHVPQILLPREFIYPTGINHCLFSLGLGMFDLKQGRNYFCPVQSKELKYEQLSETLAPMDFEFELEPGCLCIAVISLQFLRNTFAGKMFYNTVDYNPVAILKAFIADGIPSKQRTKGWGAMRFKAG